MNALSLKCSRPGVSLGNLISRWHPHHGRWVWNYMIKTLKPKPFLCNEDPDPQAQMMENIPMEQRTPRPVLMHGTSKLCKRGREQNYGPVSFEASWEENKMEVLILAENRSYEEQLRGGLSWRNGGTALFALSDNSKGGCSSLGAVSFPR